MIEKKYLKTKPVCKVKFSLSADSVASAKKVALVGDFNNWDSTAHPLRKQKSGVYATTLDLSPECDYQFRYVLDDEIWLNDDAADGIVSSPIGAEGNSLLAL